MIIPPGATSISVDVFFADDTGAAVTGKVAADFPVCKWSSGTNTSDTTITLSDLAAITTAHPNDNTAGGVKEREGGWYRLDIPNNVFTSAGRKILTFAETTNKRIIAPFMDVQYTQSDLRQLVGGSQSATDLKDFADTGYDPATHKVAEVVLTDTTTTVTNQLTAAQIATAVWTDTTAGDFTTLTSPGKIIFAQLGGAFTTTSSSVFSTAALANAPGGTAPTAAAIATAVWQDTTAGDFTVASSIGKSLYTSGNAPGAASGLAIVGSSMVAGSLATQAKTDVENAVWDASVGSHTTLNTFGDDHQSLATIYNDVVAMYAAEIAVTGSVQDAAATTTSFKTNLTDADGFWNDALLTFTSGALLGQSRVISTYVVANGVITFDEALTAAPANSVTFTIRAAHIHTKTQIADALLDRADAVETGLTPRQAMRLQSAAAAGKLSGAATTAVVIRNAVADSKNRISATVDADGNRSAVTVDLT